MTPWTPQNSMLTPALLLAYLAPLKDILSTKSQDYQNLYAFSRSVLLAELFLTSQTPDTIEVPYYRHALIPSVLTMSKPSAILGKDQIIHVIEPASKHTCGQACVCLGAWINVQKNT